LLVVSDFGSFVALFVTREFVNPELVATPCSPVFAESPAEEGVGAGSGDLKRSFPWGKDAPTDVAEEAELEITAEFVAVEDTTEGGLPPDA
jgi:hypothetical protein